MRRAFWLGPAGSAAAWSLGSIAAGSYLPYAAGVLLAALTVLAVLAVRWWRCRARRVAPTVADCGTEELGLAWELTTLLLQEAEDMPTRLRIVEARQSYLDELERRAPGRLMAWEARVIAGSAPRLDEFIRDQLPPQDSWRPGPQYGVMRRLGMLLRGERTPRP